MSVHLQRDINSLKQKLITICTAVEENLTRAVDSLEKQDESEANEVKMVESQIDQLEIEIEEECLKILALHQPVASDLRYVVSALKINNDLERIGDMALHIVERFLSIDHIKSQKKFEALVGCAVKVRKMLRTSLDALINLDLDLARSLWRLDDEIDRFHAKFFEEMLEKIKSDPEDVSNWLNLLFISKQLERIGDHATNIGEDVIYLIEGHIVRHGSGV